MDSKLNIKASSFHICPICKSQSFDFTSFRKHCLDHFTEELENISKSFMEIEDYEPCDDCPDDFFNAEHYALEHGWLDEMLKDFYGEKYDFTKNVTKSASSSTAAIIGKVDSNEITKDFVFDSENSNGEVKKEIKQEYIDEIQYLRETIDNRDKEIDRLMGQNKDLNLDVTNLKDLIGQKNYIHTNLTVEIEEQIQDNQVLQNRIEKHKESLKLERQNISSLMSENKRLKQDKTEYLKINTNLTAKLDEKENELSNLRRNLSEMEKSVKLEREKRLRLKAENEGLKHDKQNHANSLKSLENESKKDIEDLQKKIEQMEDSLKMEKDQNTKLRAENDGLAHDKQNHAKIRKILENEIREIKNKNEALEEEIGHYKNSQSEERSPNIQDDDDIFFAYE